MNALMAFGAPVAAHAVSIKDFSTPGIVYQMGLPPTRIDVWTQISGVEFDEAWQTRVEVEVEGFPIAVPSKASLLKNKRAAGRPKDLVDADILEEATRKSD